MGKKSKEKDLDHSKDSNCYDLVYKSGSKVHLISNDGINIVVDDFIYSILKERNIINE